MSGSFNPAADAAVLMSAGGAGAAGTGAHTIVVLWKSDTVNVNCGLASLYASSSQVRQILTDGGELFGTGDFSSGYPANAVALDTWYVGAISKAAGSAHYRCHLWPYASNGSGTMDHGEASDAGNHGDGSSITQIRVGLTDVRGNGLIAVVGVWNSALSDANLNTLKSGNLSAWAALSPAELISLENWDGTNGCTAVVGTSAKTGITGTVGVGANPPGFNFSVSSAVDLVVADATQAETVDNLTLTQVHALAVADARELQTVDNLALTQVHALTVADATQAELVDNLALTQVHALVVADARQLQTVDSLVLNTATNLVVADATQAQAVDNLTLTQAHALTVADAAQAELVDNLALTQAHALVVADARHLQRADQVVFISDAVAGRRPLVTNSADRRIVSSFVSRPA